MILDDEAGVRFLRRTKAAGSGGPVEHGPVERNDLRPGRLDREAAAHASSLSQPSRVAGALSTALGGSS